MRLKCIIFFSIFILFGFKLDAQFLHYGVKTFASPYLEMEFYKYAKNEYVFYFANEQNETIRFDGLDTSLISSMKPYPAIYLRYDHNVRWFFQAEVFYFWFKNEASYKNSVDFSNYTQHFNTENNQQILNYNSLQLKWRFSGIRMLAGYTFMKTKSLRPFIFTGFSGMFLMNLKMGDTYPERRYRNEIIFNHLSTFKPFTFFNTSGIGIQYQGIRIASYTQRSIGNIDIFASKYKKDSNLSIDEAHPNYKYMQGQFLSISVNIFSKNLTKNQNK